VDPLIIPIVAILMPLVLVPTILVLKHRHKRREWEHRERMRAMEGPLPLMRTAAGVGSGGVAAIGAGVPVASVVAALVTTLSWEPTTPVDVPMPAVAWGCAVVISVAGLVTSLLLALLQARAQRQMDSTVAAALNSEKPAFDPDTFDVVGSRC
jgi:ABC-type Fe3+ transport system permease subunit